MAGHSKWKQIKHKKEAADQKRGRVFSKLLNAITIAARDDPNPEFNPRLRAVVEKAREHQVPQENIERAIRKAAEHDRPLEELLIEGYGPGGSAMLISAITDNRNRTIQEVKQIFKEHKARWAEHGSVRWAFEPKEDEGFRWRPKFTQGLSPEDEEKLKILIQALEVHDDVQKVYHNAK